MIVTNNRDVFYDFSDYWIHYVQTIKATSRFVISNHLRLSASDNLSF